MKLYEITALRDAIDAELEANGGEITPEIEERIDALGLSFNEKVESTALYTRELEADIEAIEKEADRLKQMAQSRARKWNSLYAYLQLQMERMGVDKVKGKLATVSIQANTPSVRYEGSVEALPGQYVRVKPAEMSVDKKALLDAYRKGEQLPEGVSVTQTKSLRIR